jgi:FkbM family methyltransferase
METRTDQVKLRHFSPEPARDALAGEGIVWFRDVDVTAGRFQGQRVLFATDKTHDPIQRAHRNGTFYEAEDLALIAPHVPQGSTFVDIGANVGNHTVYAAMILGVARVIPVEPNPLALRLLMLNVMMNGLEDRVSDKGYGLGLAAQAGSGFGMEPRRKNLGAARMLAGEGDISVTTGDALLQGETPGFIKIDVEGMEMDALAGLSETIDRVRPPMFIEVHTTNDAAFADWLAAKSYRVLETVKRYPNNTNYLVMPADA